MEQEIFAAAAEKVRVFGIELLDIRFKRINYNESVRPKIYDRMISERRQIAERFLSEGNGETRADTRCGADKRRLRRSRSKPEDLEWAEYRDCLDHRSADNHVHQNADHGALLNCQDHGCLRDRSRTLAATDLYQCRRSSRELEDFIPTRRTGRER